MSRHADCSGDATLDPPYRFPFHHIGWQRHDQLTGSRVAHIHGERHTQRESGQKRHTISRLEYGMFFFLKVAATNGLLEQEVIVFG